MDGNPFKLTLPVASEHVGWMIVPTVGADGVTGCTLIVTFVDNTETQPKALVTV